MESTHIAENGFFSTSNRSVNNCISQSDLNRVDEGVMASHSLPANSSASYNNSQNQLWYIVNGECNVLISKTGEVAASHSLTSGHSLKLESGSECRFQNTSSDYPLIMVNVTFTPVDGLTESPFGVCDDVVPTPDEPSFIAADTSIGFSLAGLPEGKLNSYKFGPERISNCQTSVGVSELWYFTGGLGQMWIRTPDGEEMLEEVSAGSSAKVPSGYAFQFRNNSETEDLSFIIVTMPPWPGDHIIDYVEGPWEPTPPEGNQSNTLTP